MNENWHEQIQRFLDGQASVEESAALQEALIEDAELRAVYLDYVNLDVALEAAAGRSIAADVNSAEFVIVPRNHSAGLSPAWRWLAAAAACAALIGFVFLSGQRSSTPAHPEIAAAFDSTRAAIARLSVEPTASSSWWSSPTASLLNPRNALPRNERTP